MRPPRACSFDLDGTLLDSGGNADRALVATCEAVAATLPALDAVQLLRANREVWPPYWQDVEDQWTLGGLTGADLSLEVWRRTLEVCGCIDESIVRMARDMHSLHQREALRIFDDVQGVLASLRGRGIALALITNGASDTQREAVEATDLARYFDTIVISAEEGIAKPDPAVFIRALNALDVEPQNAWHVGDSLRLDVAGGRAAGLTAVWLNRGGTRLREHDARPDYEFQSLTELKALLAAGE